MSTLDKTLGEDNVLELLLAQVPKLATQAEQQQWVKTTKQP
ncbi:hypothetical protein HanRHA438_Chr17g0832571 [Helianthus annuus]|nr:hypothetical protein HanHA89_Chr17g0722891 [Helianthus annuus]KAJ0814810.1 hypothetical protein HanPSC8_Chr17g0790211 [Helianthus annuus]KAJ0828031.1 hypothetical protein HanRHA438_Chr17g0832571 [Helianthus annuus]